MFGSDPKQVRNQINCQSVSCTNTNKISPAELLAGHRCVFGSCRDWGLLLTVELLQKGLFIWLQTDISCISSELIHRKSFADPLW